MKLIGWLSIAVALVLGAIYLVPSDTSQPVARVGRARPFEESTSLALVDTRGSAEDPREHLAADVAPVRALPEGLGSVTVQLLVPDGREPSAGAIVEVYKGNRTHRHFATGAANRLGEASFELPPGEYKFMVDAGTLRGGLLPPALQKQVYSNFWPGLHAPVIDLAAGEQHEVQIPLSTSGRVWGYAYDESNQPISDLEIRIRSIQLHTLVIHRKALTNADGFFEAYLSPGQYRFGPMPQKGHAQLGPTRPLPHDVALETDQDVRVDFHWNPGECTITGTLLDPPLIAGEEEILWEGLRVFVLPSMGQLKKIEHVLDFNLADALARAYTDETGTFRLTNLQPGNYRLSFAPYEGFDTYSETCKLGCFIPTLDVQLRGPGVHDVGTILAPRARRARVNGMIVSTEPDTKLNYSYVQMKVTHPVVLSSPRTIFKPVEIGPDGSFSFWIFASPDSTPAIVEVKRWRDEEWFRQEVAVVPDEVHVIQVPFGT